MGLSIPHRDMTGILQSCLILGFKACGMVELTGSMLFSVYGATCYGSALEGIQAQESQATSFFYFFSHQQPSASPF